MNELTAKDRTRPTVRDNAGRARVDKWRGPPCPQPGQLAWIRIHPERALRALPGVRLCQGPNGRAAARAEGASGKAGQGPQAGEVVEPVPVDSSRVLDIEEVGLK